MTAKRIAIAGGLAGGLIATGLILYSHFIGFEKEPLASKVPDDAYAYLSVRHLRKATLAFATDDQLQASFDLLQALGELMGVSSSPSPSDFSVPDINPQLLQGLAKHFKTQAALVAFSLGAPDGSLPEIALIAHFYGVESEWETTLQEIALQATRPSTRYRWIDRTTVDFSYRELEIEDAGNPQPPAEIQPCWTVYQKVLYAATSPATLLKLLAFQKTQDPLLSIAPRIAAHQVEPFLPQPDLTLFLNTRPILQTLATAAEKSLDANGGLAASLSPKILIEELGFNELDSFLFAFEIDSWKRLYSGFTYKSRRGLLDAFAPAQLSIQQAPGEITLYAANSYNLDAGKSLLIAKNALLKAAPLANFAYFGIQSRAYSATGRSLDDTLRNGFDNHLVALQSLDLGTGFNADASLSDSVVYDYALKFKLAENTFVRDLLESQLPPLLAGIAPYPYSYRKGQTFYYDRDADTRSNDDRFALSYDADSLTFGAGTLRSFQLLKEREEFYASPENPSVVPFPKVGSGTLSLQALPSTLFKFSSVIYQQAHPGLPLPIAFNTFDWTAFTALEQERESGTYLDPSGRIFHVSQQTR